MLAGAFLMGFAAILTALNFIVSVHKLRALANWGKFPLFIWSLYATNIIQILHLLLYNFMLLAAERNMGIGIFDEAGEILSLSNFFLVLFSSGYIMILPAMGIINEVIPFF